MRLLGGSNASAPKSCRPVLTGGFSTERGFARVPATRRLLFLGILSVDDQRRLWVFRRFLSPAINAESKSPPFQSQAKAMNYRCEAASLSGFVQQLAVSYLANGYWFYVTGEIPAHKEPTKTDRKIIEQYGVGISKWARARRKKAGLANVQYLRLEHFYVILATRGAHVFFEREKARLKDARETPIKVAGYSISFRRSRGGNSWHPSVRIECGRYLELKAYFEKVAVHRSIENLVKEFFELRLELYAPVKAQLACIFRAVNRRRKTAGFQRVPISVLSGFRRSIVALKPPHSISDVVRAKTKMTAT